MKIPAHPYPEYPGWEVIDCGCCAGIKWGGESPETCKQCAGGGWLARHIASGAVAVYPGGPFRWRESRKAAPRETEAAA